MNLWPFVPQVDLIERILWSTDIIDTLTTEQRIANRPYPRTEYDMSVFAYPTQLETARQILQDTQLDDLNVPLWNEIAFVGNLTIGQTIISVDTTIARYLDGQEVFVTGDEGNVELTTLASHTDTDITVAALVYNHTNAHIAPAYPFKFKTGLRNKKYANDITKVDVGFEGSANYGITGVSPFPTHNGKPVVTTPSLIGGTGDSLQRESNSFNNVAGPIAKIRKYNYDVKTSSLIMEMDNKAEVWAIRQWLYFIKGRQVSFYVPTWTYDFKLAAPVSTFDTELTIEPSPYFENGYVGRIMVLLKDGTIHFNNVTASTANSLTVSPYAGYTVAIDDVQLICRMPLMRSATDTFELKHRIGGVTSLTMALREVK